MSGIGAGDEARLGDVEPDVEPSDVDVCFLISAEDTVYFFKSFWGLFFYKKRSSELHVHMWQRGIIVLIMQEMFVILSPQ